MPQAKPSTEGKGGGKVHQLSEDDVVRLLNPQQGTSARLDVTGKIATNYGMDGLSAEQLLIAEQIFRLLVRDTELDIRKKLSDHLKISAQLPRDIALTMANDVAEVALPMLEYSVVLTDLDLADLIEATPDVSRHVAIAKRKDVSENVVAALLQNSEEPLVAQTLVTNETAKLNNGAMETLVARHNDMPDMMGMLAARPNLPPTIREKVITYVSDQLKSELSKHHVTAKDIVQKEAALSRIEATLDLINDDLNEQEMTKLVNQLITFERLTPVLLLAALVRGYINFYVVAMAVMGSIPVENTLRLLRDRGGLGFRGLYNKCDLPPEHFIVLRELTPMAIELKEHMSGLEGQGFAKLLTKRVMEQYKDKNKPYSHLLTAIASAIEM